MDSEDSGESELGFSLGHRGMRTHVACGLITAQHMSVQLTSGTSNVLLIIAGCHLTVNGQTRAAVI